jgi:hypothetical protein
MNRVLVLVSFSLMAIGCGGSGNGSGGMGNPNGSGDPVPATPSAATAVQPTYEQIGNSCNGGQLTRSLAQVRALDANDLWTTPGNDASALATTKSRTAGWAAPVAVSKLDFDGIAESFETTSAEQTRRCDAAREIFTPFTQKGRAHFLNLLIYAGDHPREAAFPADRRVPEPVEAPARLTGYLSVASGIRQDGPDDGTTTYREVQEQHIPIQISCEKPLQVAREFISVSDAEAATLDPSICSLEDQVWLCLFERLKPVADNRCTFVAVNARYQTSDGTTQALSLGGRIDSMSEPGRARLTVDRYAFHVTP